MNNNTSHNLLNRLLTLLSVILFICVVLSGITLYNHSTDNIAYAQASEETQPSNETQPAMETQSPMPTQSPVPTQPPIETQPTVPTPEITAEPIVNNDSTLSDNEPAVIDKAQPSVKPTKKPSKKSDTKNKTPKNKTPKNKKSKKKTKPKTLTLSMVGDMLMHLPVCESGRQKNGKYNYDLLFKHIKKDVEKYDISMVNEEVLIAGTSFGISGYPQFNSRFELGNAIEKAGFDVIVHATNHSMDKGKAGLIADLKHWKSAHPDLKVVGMYLSRKESQNITYIKKNGIKVAILNYTYGTNGIRLPSDMPYAVNLMSETKVRNDVKKAKKKADIVIVCPHWGTEYKDTPDAYQQKWTNIFLKYKVDIVIGTHPHVIEPVKWVSDKKGHKMLVYYSLGNYVNSCTIVKRGLFRQYLGGMADITLEKNKKGRTYIKDAGFIPLITHYGNDGKITTYHFKDYDAKKAKTNRVSRYDYSYSYDAAKKHFKRVISKSFLKNI